jgi:hypothetical protein
VLVATIRLIGAEARTAITKLISETPDLGKLSGNLNTDPIDSGVRLVIIIGSLILF